MINHKIASISISVFYQSMTKNKELKTAYAVSFLHKNILSNDISITDEYHRSLRHYYILSSIIDDMPVFPAETFLDKLLHQNHVEAS